MRKMITIKCDEMIRLAAQIDQRLTDICQVQACSLRMMSVDLLQQTVMCSEESKHQTKHQNQTYAGINNMTPFARTHMHGGAMEDLNH